MSVDVIIPVHDGAAFIERAVRSALREGPADTSVICFDDASGDSSPDILNALASDPRVVVLREATNVGVAAARNRAIAAGRGEFIAFLDQDDELTEGSLELRIDALRSRPDAGYVVGRQRFVVTDGVVPHWVRPEWLRDSHAGFLPGGLMTRRTAFDLVGPFDESLRFGGDDPDWFARARFLGVGFVELDDVVLIRHVHDRNRSSHPNTDTDLLAFVRRHLHRGDADA